MPRILSNLLLSVNVGGIIHTSCPVAMINLLSEYGLKQDRVLLGSTETSAQGSPAPFAAQGSSCENKYLLTEPSEAGNPLVSEVEPYAVGPGVMLCYLELEVVC
jgi:hypothetical protein